MGLKLSLRPISSATVTLATGTAFEVASDETILEAAGKAGIWLPSACRTGACGSCKVTVSSGDFFHAGSVAALSAAEQDGCTALLCRAHALGDLQLDVAELPEPPPSERPAVPARVVGLIRESEHVMRLTLRFSALDPLDFIPGQFIGLRHSDGFDRSFSIANAPRVDGTVDLHVGRVAGGVFTGHVFEHLRVNDILRVTGPFGNFTCASVVRPAIFIAGGTGIAPVRAILESLAGDSFAAPVYVYWGSRTQSGLYLDRELREFSERHGIAYIPVVSDRADAWSGRAGLVHEAVLQDFDDLSAFDIYACGSPAMVDAAHKAVLARGARRDRFFSDCFHPSRPAADSQLNTREVWS
ncbi:MAG: 2Fe-2S iron-sulfur cluster binding domain-containing protein [Xanthobacteraceae bacterium]|nr:2Fe-2S iron-sulfur cluster binding domain-containing protein [Xanthobacteraceae bacterium]